MPSIDLPIIGALVHPPIGLLTETIEGTHGPGPLDLTLTPPQGPLALTYGVRIRALTHPAGWGRKLGNPSQFNPFFCQLASVYQMLGGTPTVTQQIEFVTIDGTCYFWQEALPFELLVHIEPGWTLVLSWMQT